MENFDLSALWSSQPELYIILAVIAYAVRKGFPLIAKSLEIKQKLLDSSVRQEQGITRIIDILQDNTVAIKTLPTKSDIITLLASSLNMPPPSSSMNGSGNSAKQVM